MSDKSGALRAKAGDEDAMLIALPFGLLEPGNGTTDWAVTG